MTSKKLLFAFFLISFLSIGCKKSITNKLVHRWQVIEIPPDEDNTEVWSFDSDGSIYNIVLNNSGGEDTLGAGTYAVLNGKKLRIAGFLSSYNADWKLTKLNSEVMVIINDEYGGIATREFLRVD